MKDQVKELLKGLGVPAQTIADLQDDEKLKELDVAEVKKSTLLNLQTVFKNDSAFTGEIERGLRASILSSKEKKMMTAFNFLGVTQEELDALPDKNRFDAQIELLGKKSRELEKGGDGDSEKTKLEIRNLNEAIAGLKGKVKEYDEVTIPGIKNQINIERQGLKLETIARKSIGKHDLIIEQDFAYSSVMGSIKGAYDIKLDDSGKAQVFNKGTNNEAFDNDNQKITFDGLVKKTVTDAKLVKKSNGKPGGRKEGEGSGEEGRQQPANSRLPGLQNSVDHGKKLKEGVNAGE